MTVAEICRMGRISATTLYRRRNQEKWQRRSTDSATDTKKTKIEPATRAGGQRAELIGRLYRAFERQVGEAEARLETASSQGAGGEKEARTLGTLARTLEKLIELQGELEETKPDEDVGRVDLGRLRRKLARRIAAMRRSEET